jgi:hypothetical protein
LQPNTIEKVNEWMNEPTDPHIHNAMQRVPILLFFSLIKQTASKRKLQSLLYTLNQSSWVCVNVIFYEFWFCVKNSLHINSILLPISQFLNQLKNVNTNHHSQTVEKGGKNHANVQVSLASCQMLLKLTIFFSQLFIAP